jgi:cytokinin riboside 5'-monophosphate phosphoribohydrolase
MNKVICVYSSSSCTIDKVYFEAAAKLGSEIALREDIFLYGGGLTGLMGACAQAVHQNNGKVIGIIPEALNVKGIVYDRCDELVVTKGMRERKAQMDERSDAFIALPGGYGTLEEILEIITLKQLRYHNKPIVILNIYNFFDNLLSQFDAIVEQNFAKADCKKLYFTTDDVSKALEYIDTYSPPIFKDKWFTDVNKE